MQQSSVLVDDVCTYVCFWQAELGGVAYLEEGSNTIPKRAFNSSGSTYSSNSCTAFGGALYVHGYDATISDSAFTNNKVKSCVHDDHK